MREIYAAVTLSALAACGATTTPIDLSQTDIGTLAGCPKLPGIDSVVIAQKDGIDYRLCNYTHKETGKVLFEVYVGEHPPNPGLGLEYAGATRNSGKDLIWFTTPSTGGWNSPRTWHTYLPTGSPRGTIMVVTFTTQPPHDLRTIATLVAHLQPSI